MNYLIIHQGHEPFYTNWFDAQNNFVSGMVVFNLLTGYHTTDGNFWQKTNQDHL